MGQGANARVQWLLALSLACAGCALPQQVGSDCGDEAECEQAGIASGVGPLSGGGISSMPGTRSNTVPRGGRIERADVLFVVNDSPAMAATRTALAAAIPAFVRALASGDADLGGKPDFRAVQDLHLGMISGRMRAGGLDFPAAPDCSPGAASGSGGELSAACLPPAAHFASMLGEDGLQRASDELACMVRLYATGCESPQPFEAALKALWPSSGLVPPGMIFSDGSRGGHIGNLGFVRRDSLIVVVVVSDVDDCSSLQPEQLSGRSGVALLHRCSVRPEVRTPIERYLTGLRQQRPGGEDLVMFFALAGIPLPTATPRFDRDDEREDYYATLLGDERMQPNFIDAGQTPNDGDDDIPRAMCTTSSGPIYPARRMVELAQGFALDGMVLSLCQPDLQPALLDIAQSIGRRIGPPAI